MPDFKMDELPPIDELSAAEWDGASSGLLPRDQWPSWHLVSRWNWGAFALCPLWLLWHGRPGLGIVAFVLAFIPVVNVVFAAYVAPNANAIALTRRPFRSAEQFLAVQRKWAQASFICAGIAGLYVLPVIVALAFVYLLMVV